MKKGNLVSIRKRTVPQVMQLFDLEKVEVVFDVGANVGQSAKQYAAEWPDAKIYCFEPIQKSFDALSEATESLSNVQCFRLALSEDGGEKTMRSSGTSTVNAIVTGKEVGDGIEAVLSQSGDAFCREYGVERINFLKIDTEGHDMKVLLGFLGMLREKCIDFIQVEASMNVRNPKHVHFSSFFTFLTALGYEPSGVFEQALDRRLSGLRRSNLLFVSSRVGLL